MEALSVARPEERRPAEFRSTGEGLIRDLLLELGEDPNRDGLVRTPHRVWESLSQLTDGYTQDALDVVGDALFAEETDGMVTLQGVEFYSLCEHHLLPFFGHVHIAYLPDGQIVGLSKLPRLVDLFSHRLQVQERLTTQIADACEELLHPRGVAVVVEASHLCLMMRGVEKQGVRTVTTVMRGTFDTDPALRRDFLDQVQHATGG